ncbi:xylulokinase [Vineibacter terrae]|uniref:Xylulose kinase n=1 Tax=Vineibacter terrae TaxID=2586908 RepID=A0A5C8PMG7_9HYPH|nr:xylulokinase [Vineibacter terrae]TXL75463.1 xylulokinase [Vineibacter terrae]
MSEALMYLGIDIGTSSVKAVLVDDTDRLLAEAAHPVPIARPRPLWSEQDPDDWWRAVSTVLDRLAAEAPAGMAAVRAIGLSGQMLGVTLLDAADRPVRPALLWNDGRASAECAALHDVFADFPDIVGCRAMPGFSAPKLLWLSRHEPAGLSRTRRILLPKDYVRLRLTGAHASDRADASAMLLMDTRRGDWHDGIIAACGIDRAWLPRLVDSAEVSGGVRPGLAARWRLAPGTPVVGGAGDNMCAGVGVGAVAPDDAYISLGTSGVYFVANDVFAPARGAGMHTHRHAVAGLYCQQAVVLSAAAALAWIAGVLGRSDIGALLAEVEAAQLSPADTPVFTPYLAGERTPHDDPHLTATFSGLTHSTGPAHLVHAVLEGVALALADGHEALAASGARLRRLTLTGGGARSRLWARLIASAIDMPVSAAVREGPALGAARLARAGAGGPLLAGAEASSDAIVPETALRDALLEKRKAFHAHLRLRRLVP